MADAAPGDALPSTISTTDHAQHHDDDNDAPSPEGTPPPLPPRPKRLPVQSKPSYESFRLGSASPRAPLQSRATTALSLPDVQTYESTRDASGPSPTRQFSIAGSKAAGSDAGDTASLRSYAPTLEAGAEVESILGEVMAEQENVAWKAMAHPAAGIDAQALFPEDPALRAAFDREFEDMDDFAADGSNEEALVLQWRSKLKHYLILSSAGKPIYSRHGDDQLIANSIGVVQTIISFYQDAQDTLRGFTAGGVRFVVLSKGPLNLVAITKFPESEGQLRTQLESLYMQILSTLTLPQMERMFRARASTDLRRPLQGTETLLSALADGFTRGSPSTLLSALECLRLRKSQRKLIDNTFLKTRASSLLYGLIVAGGRLVSVIRPKKHSLHPGDLQLIFNMLFEAGSVKAAGGENWIPLCLPGFNNTGYLYMYVSFLSVQSGGTDQEEERPSTAGGEDNEIAIILISADKEGFFELRDMKDQLVKQLSANGCLDTMRDAVRRGRPLCTDIVPGTPLRHFLYKSRSHVQFTMPSYSPTFESALDRRRLINIYTPLHTTLHTRPASSAAASAKIIHSSTTHATAIAWSTPRFELYGVAPGATSRAALAQAVGRVVQWVKREEERVFIVGGGVF
ncbi:trafficking protein Mon1-domain-containing protein [Phyllosticta capitalensis]|uniref:Vacuolar fusion protein MON1 n=1 Tax=Phyllosticta capitalensis TaxID=121624 RepID=A0ABR1YEK3_9PEZI